MKTIIHSLNIRFQAYIDTSVQGTLVSIFGFMIKLTIIYLSFYKKILWIKNYNE